MRNVELTDIQRSRSLAALAEITRESSVGQFLGRVDNEDGSYGLIFECLLPGYPGWQWTVSIAEVDGDEPTVIEAELLPTETALVAPDWVPWSQRLAEYLEAQKQAGIDEEAALAQMQAEAMGDEDDLEGFDDDDDDDDEESEDESDDEPDDELDDDELEVVDDVFDAADESGDIVGLDGSEGRDA